MRKRESIFCFVQEIRNKLMRPSAVISSLPSEIEEREISDMEDILSLSKEAQVDILMVVQILKKIEEIC